MALRTHTLLNHLLPAGRSRRMQTEKCFAQLHTSDTAAKGKVEGGDNSEWALSTTLLHADAHVSPWPDVAPPLRVTTTFRKGNDEGLVYSRSQSSTRTRVEMIIGRMCGGHAITYSSGLAAVLGLVVGLKPRAIVLDAGYHGTRLVIALLAKFSQATGGATRVLTMTECADFSADQLRAMNIGLIFLEAPSNPNCIIPDFAPYRALAKSSKACFAVDATLSSPLGFDAFEWGVDVVMHSSTKYLGGHSDLLGGVLVCRQQALAARLADERVFLGAVMGTLECHLLLRSLRTLALRVNKQSETAEHVALWLDRQTQVATVWHCSVPSHPSYQRAKQMLKLPPACFAFCLRSQAQAMRLPERLRLFTQATSLGGVESLIDWRYQYDTTVDPALLRVSIGLEDPVDLIQDLAEAFADL